MNYFLIATIIFSFAAIITGAMGIGFTIGQQHGHRECVSVSDGKTSLPLRKN